MLRLISKVKGGRTRCLLFCGLVATVATLSGCSGYTAASSANKPGNSPSGQGPSITVVSSSAVTAAGATITWATNVGATSQVKYGTTTGYGQSSTLDSNMVTSHSVALTNLTAATTYHFYAVSQDASGNATNSADATFTTVAAGPPVISAVGSSGINASNATITWTTNVGASSQVNYGTTTAYGQSSSANSTLVTSHSVALANLNSATLYHFQVVSAGGNGAQAKSADFSFTTGTPGTPPTISGVGSSGITVSGGTVTWTTNVGATSQVNYGTTASYGQSTALNASLVTSHSVAVSGLSPATVYHYQVVSQNSNGDIARGADGTFTTLADTTAPSVPVGLSGTGVSATQINLTWTPSTDNVGVSGYDVYRNGTKVGTSASGAYSDVGLTASTSYSYSVDAFDGAGNTSGRSTAASVTTLGQGSGNGTCAGGMPCALGWYQIPGTSLSSLCPAYSDIQGSTGCGAVASAWGSALVDTNRNRLILHGGGHVDYYGNEIYAIDFNNLTGGNPATVLVKDASHGVAIDAAVVASAEAFPDGTPNSRHDYNGWIYLPITDEYFLYGGGLSNLGSFTDGNWVYSPASGNWTHLTPGTHPATAVNGSIPANAYNSADGCLYMEETNLGNFWQYCRDSANNGKNWTLLTGSLGAAEPCESDDYSATVDPSDGLWVCAGSGEIGTVKLASPYTPTKDATASGCNGNSIVAASAPGLAWDPIQKVAVLWAGGNSVLEYNPVAHTCTTVTFSGGNPNPQASGGTFGRFAYMPGLGGFVLFNAMNQNAYFLRLVDPVSAAAMDYANRCSAAGVIYCEGFDNAADFTHLTNQNQSGLFQGNDAGCAGTSNCYGSQDASTYRSGGSALLFTIPGAAGADPSGFWKQMFTPSLSASPAQATVFGQNSHFYISYAQRMDAPYITNPWPATGGGTTNWKQQIISSDQSTCGNIEITTVNAYNRGYPETYSQCGADGFQTTVGSTLYQEMNQQVITGSGTTGYACIYNTPQPEAGCYDYVPNVWTTYYYDIQIGTWGSPNSNINEYLSTPTSPGWREWIYQPNHTLNNDAGLPAYDTVTLIPYWTNRDAGVSAGPTSHTWYDELIISSQPIAPPQAPPAAP